MFGFGEMIYEFLKTFVRYICMLVQNIITAVTYLVSSQQAITVIIGYMPAVIGGACLAFIAIAVMRFMLMK